MLSNITSLNRNDQNNIKINFIPNFIIEDIYKRGFIQNVVNDPVIIKAIENIRYSRLKDGSANILDIIRELWISTSIITKNLGQHGD